MFWVIDYLLLAFIVAAAVIVVRVVNLSGAVMALSAMGVFLSLLFVVLGAPDDAHAEIVVGAIALPTFYLVALGKIRTAVADEPELGESGGSGGSGGSGESGGSADDTQSTEESPR